MEASAKPAFITAIFDASGAGSGALSRAAEETSRLFDHHRHGLIRYLDSFGLPHPDREEVVQETFIALFVHLKQGGDEDNIPGWLFRVARNQALKCRNRRERDRTTDMDGLVIDPPGEVNTEREMLDAERHQQLRAVILALSSDERQCLLLRAEGLRYREIAGVLNVSVTSVSNLLARALGKLKRANELYGKR
jgi:RNA polymerase sigma-70 factor, ECF subfamily